MIKLGNILTRHRNLILLMLLVMTLVVSGMVNRRQLEAASATVDIPVIETHAQPASALESYRWQRNEDTQNDVSALERLCSQPSLDAQTREAAAAQLQAIIENNQAQLALEAALLNSSLAPCVAVVAGGSVTIVTEKTTVTAQDAALVMTLAAAHANAAPEDVRIITAD